VISTKFDDVCTGGVKISCGASSITISTYNTTTCSGQSQSETTQSLNGCSEPVSGIRIKHTCL
jgi:hypothetical protein